MNDFIIAYQVAEIIGFNSDAEFLRARDRLERDHGFPEPLPTIKRPFKWRRSAVQEWADMQSQLQAAEKVVLLDRNLMKEAARA